MRKDTEEPSLKNIELIEDNFNSCPSQARQFLSYRRASDLSGLGYHVIQRAAKCGLLKTYSLGTSKKYVTLKDIFEAASTKN